MKKKKRFSDFELKNNGPLIAQKHMKNIKGGNPTNHDVEHEGAIIIDEVPAW